MAFSHKLVAILNKDIETGVALNALGHMAIGMGTTLTREDLHLEDYRDAEGHVYPNISGMPFIILRAKSGEIRKTVHAAREQQMIYGVFLQTMTGGTWVEQFENTQKSREEELIYYGCLLLGPWEGVSLLTKRFSLWK